MSASSHPPIRPVAGWTHVEPGSLSDDSERLPWTVAAPLIAIMALLCWVAVWKIGTVLLAFLL
jgi:hypothetical protein